MSAADGRHVNDHMGAPAFSQLPPDLRETRLRNTIDELRWSRDGYRREVNRLRDRCENQAIKMRLLRAERDRLEERLHLMERELTKKGKR